MSMSLLKKSMAIVEANLADNKKSIEKEIGGKKKGIHKKDNLRNEMLFKNRARKKTIEDIRKELQLNSKKAENNVKKLLSLSNHPVKIPNAEKIIERAHSGRYTITEKKPAEEKSLFTEEDFAAFEKELELEQTNLM